VSSFLSRRQKHTVTLQLDYYMSPQFAGIASAITSQLYEKNGIDLKFLPICPVGHELERVRNNAKMNGVSSVSIGSVEQNIFIPTLYANPELKVKAVAAMFRRSPLCLASLESLKKQNEKEKIVVGAHEDTVSLIERILSTGSDSNRNFSVISSPRATKNSDLTAGKLDSIQAYTTTEVPTLERQAGLNVNTQQLEGMNGAKLGYSQVLFSPEEDLEIGDKREVVQAFLDATFSGWEIAIRDNETAAKSVNEAIAMLKLDDENNDHWDSSFSYTVQSVGLCNDFVKETYQGDRHGVIDVKRWNDATSWLLAEEVEPVGDTNFGLNAEVWQPPSQLLAGNELARTTLHDARKSAIEFKEAHGRKPSIAVITVGELPRYTHGKMRLKIYSNDENSWFNKTLVGEANGFNVKEINLPESTSEDDLLSQVYSLKDVDGIQLMWPLPSHIDAAKVYGSIDVDRDVDGAHYIGQLELFPKNPPLPPVTPTAVVNLMKNYSIDIKNKEVLVVGRSRIVGSPLAHMLRNEGAIVTVAHSEVPVQSLEGLVRKADIVFSCAGSPGLLKTEWLKQGADVINIGTTFSEETESLCSDFDGDLASVAGRFSPVPGGVGPLSVAFLFKNVAAAAWRRASNFGDIELSWTMKSSSLQRSIHFNDYDSALGFANKVNTMSSGMDHHANMAFSHKCVNGVDLDLDFFTFEANTVTAKDYEAAKNVNLLLENEKIRMSNFTYQLDQGSIAKYPADPRGSSRLIRVDSDGIVSHYDNFSQIFYSLSKGAHIVFNESKVVKARLFVHGKEKNIDIEMMILDLGNAVDKKCDGAHISVMLRSEGVKIGDSFLDRNKEAAKFRVVKVVGPWIEDENSQGNGTECLVEFMVDDEITLGKYLENSGQIPIPPYLNRDAEMGDERAYNNVYAAGNGSVAAPTAGLHFTDELLAKFGAENTSFLSLHVGAGTFKPVVTEDARDHSMHGEHFSVKVAEINRIIQVLEEGKRMIVVGTTTSRTLESLYWCGVKILQKKNTGVEGGTSNNEMMTLNQNEWSHLSNGSGSYSAPDALRAVIEGRGSTDIVNGRTSLMIVPGSYDFKVVEDLVTNFHAPDSTLMLLVSAFLGNGEKVRDVYHEAQDLGYRFLSYGDACFFSRPKR